MNSRALAAAAALTVLVVAFAGTADAARTPKQSSSVVTYTQPDIEWYPSAGDCTRWQEDICREYRLSGLPTLTPAPSRTAQAIRSVALSAQVAIPSGAGLGLVSPGGCDVAVLAQWRDEAIPQNYDYAASIVLFDREVGSSTPSRTLITGSTEAFLDLDDGGTFIPQVILWCTQNLAPTEALTIENIRWLISSVGA